MAHLRLPLAVTAGEREPADAKDAMLKNCYVETIEIDSQAGEKGKEVLVTKRPGLKAHTDLSAATTDTGRGVYEWKGNIYSIVGDEVFKGTSDIGQINTTSGVVRFDQAFDGTGKLVFHDGTTFYTINTSDTITERNNGGTSGATDDEQMLTNFVPGIVVLDQYAFLMDSDGNIQNSVVGDVDDWAGDTIVAEIKSDAGVALARYRNYLVGLCDDTIEFFYDAANTNGSPMNRFEGMAANIGCAAGNTVVNVDQDLLFVAKSPEGGRFVAGFIGGFEAKRISTTAIDEILDKEGSNISNAYAYTIRVAGKNLYVLTLPTTAARTFVADLDEKKWYEWSSDVSDTESFFTAMDATELNGDTILLDDSNGRTYEFDPETYQDVVAGSNEGIKMEVRTPQTDNGNMMNKFMSRLQLVGDIVASTGTVGIEYSDDDYVTWSTSRTQDMASYQTWLSRLGVYKRRAFRLKWQQNLPARWAALEANIEQGHYGRD
jgi:hypothetical protein